MDAHIFTLFPCSSPSPFPLSSLYLPPFLLTVFLPIYSLPFFSTFPSLPPLPFLPLFTPSSFSLLPPPSLQSFLPLFTPSSLSSLLPPSLHSFLHHPFLPFPSFLPPSLPPSLPPLSTDPYVKVYILHKGKKHDKWKSTIKRNTLLPIFNEPFQRL